MPKEPQCWHRAGPRGRHRAETLARAAAVTCLVAGAATAAYAVAFYAIPAVPGPPDYLAVALAGILVAGLAAVSATSLPPDRLRTAALTGAALALTPLVVLVIALGTSDG